MTVMSICANYLAENASDQNYKKHFTMVFNAKISPEKRALVIYTSRSLQDMPCFLRMHCKYRTKTSSFGVL